MNQQNLLAHVFPELMIKAQKLSLDHLNKFLDKKVSEFVSSRDLKVVDVKPLDYGRLGPENVGFNSKIKGHVSLDENQMTVIGLNEFNSIRADVCVYSGKWMYEVILGSRGVMQLGWCTEHCKFNDENGVGDTPNSYGFDGNRIKLWNVRSRTYGESWEIGDVISCCIDLNEATLEYFKNGKSLGIAYDKITVGPGIVYYPAISLSQGDNIIVNFGNAKFQYELENYKPIHHQNKELLAQCQCLINYLERLIPITSDVMKIVPVSNASSNESNNSSGLTQPTESLTDNLSIQSSCWLLASNLLSRLEPLIKQRYISDTCFIQFLMKFCDFASLTSYQSHICLILDMIWSFYQRETAICIVENLILGIVTLYEVTPLDVSLKSQNKYLHLILSLLKHQTTKLFILEHHLFGRFKLPMLMHLKSPSDQTTVGSLTKSTEFSAILNQLITGDYWGYAVCVPDACHQHKSIAHIPQLRAQFTDAQLKAQYTLNIHKIQLAVREMEDIQTEILHQLIINDYESDPVFRTIFLQNLFRFLRNHLNSLDFISCYNTSMLMSLFHRLVNLIRILWKNISNRYTGISPFEDLAVPIVMFSLPGSCLIQMNSPRIGGRFNLLSKGYKPEIDMLIYQATTFNTTNLCTNTPLDNQAGDQSKSSSSTSSNSTTTTSAASNASHAHSTVAGNPKKHSEKRRFINFKHFPKFLVDSKNKKNKSSNPMQDIVLEEKHIGMLHYPVISAIPSTSHLATNDKLSKNISSASAYYTFKTNNTQSSSSSALFDNNSSTSNNASAGSTNIGSSPSSGFTFLPIRVEPLALYTGLLSAVAGTSSSSNMSSSSSLAYESPTSTYTLMDNSSSASANNTSISSASNTVSATSNNLPNNPSSHHEADDDDNDSPVPIPDSPIVSPSTRASASCDAVYSSSDQLESFLGELTSILQMVEVTNVIYHIAANDHYTKLVSIRNKAHNLIVAIIDLTDRLQRAQDEDTELIDTLKKSLETCEQKLVSVTQRFGFFSATELSEEKRDNILWLWTTILSTIEEGKADKLYCFLPTYYLENMMNIFRHITQIFHPTLQLEGLRDSSSVLGMHGQLLLYSYRDKRIISNNLRNPIIKSISELLQLPLSIRYLEQRLQTNITQQSNPTTSDVYLFLSHLVNDWTDSMIVLNRFWRGDGFAYRYQELPHQQLSEFHLRDAAVKIMEKPNSSKFFQNQLKILLKDNATVCTNFIDLILNKINWSFSEVVSNMQELNQHRGTRMDRLADIRFIRTCSLCFDITVSLLRILEMVVYLVPDAFVDPARSNSELFLNRLFSSISQIFNRCLSKGLFPNIINLKINGLDQIDYFPIIVASLGVLIGLVLDAPKKFSKSSSSKLVEVMIKDSNFMQQTFDRISVGSQTNVEQPVSSSLTTIIDKNIETNSSPLSTSQPAIHPQHNQSDVYQFDVCQYPNYINSVEVHRVRTFLDLVKKESSKEELSNSTTKDEDLCTICYAHVKNTIFKPCNHSTCKNCITYQMMTNPVCFFCKADIKKVEDLSGKDLHIKPNKNSSVNSTSSVLHNSEY